MTNFRLAQESFELAAQAGHAQSAYMVGYMYEHGIVESNIEKAVKYHTMAAAVASNDAKLILIPMSKCHATIVGVESRRLGEYIAEAVDEIAENCF